MADEKDTDRGEAAEVEAQSQQRDEGLQPQESEETRTGEEDSGDGTNEIFG